MKLSVLVIAFIVALAFEGCKSKEKTTEVTKNEALANDTLLYYKTNSCFSRCPEFELIVRQNGAAQVNGIRFYDWEGVKKAKLSNDQLQNLQNDINVLNPYAMAAVYDDPKVQDVQSRKYIFKKEGERKEIFSRYQAPNKLREFQRVIKRLISSTAFN